METGLVLVAEHNPQYRRLLEMRLGMGGYDVTAAESGEEAVSRLDHVRPTAIVSDVEMPGVDGLTLCRQVRADDRYADTPILLLGSDDPSADLRRVVALGKIAWLSKNADWTLVAGTLQALISQTEPLASAAHEGSAA